MDRFRSAANGDQVFAATGSGSQGGADLGFSLATRPVPRLSARKFPATRSPKLAGVPLQSAVFLFTREGLGARGGGRSRLTTCSTSAASTFSSIDASSYQTQVQPLKLAFRHGVEIHTRSDLGRTHPLQPTQQNLSGTRIGNSALAQTTLDLRVGSVGALREDLTGCRAEMVRRGFRFESGRGLLGRLGCRCKKRFALADVSRGRDRSPKT